MLFKFRQNDDMRKFIQIFQFGKVEEKKEDQGSYKKDTSLQGKSKASDVVSSNAPLAKRDRSNKIR